MRIPPTAGPTEAPTIPASAHTRPAAASLPVASERRSSAAQTTAAPAMPWAARIPTSTSNVGARAQPNDATASATIAAPNTRFGRRRASHAAGIAASASARLNEISAQASVETSTSYWIRILGSATVTTDESASTSPTERPRSAMRCRGARDTRPRYRLVLASGSDSWSRERDQQARHRESAALFEVSSEHRPHHFCLSTMNPSPGIRARR